MRGPRRRTRCVLTLVVAALLVTACGRDDEPDARPRATTSTVRPTTSTSTPTTLPPYRRLIAESTEPVSIYDNPSAAQPSQVVPPGYSGKAVFLVRRVVDDAWLDVDLPVKPNGSTGFVRRSDVQLSRTDFAVAVLTGEHRIVVTKGDFVVFDASIATGKTATPTPGGRFYITALLRPPDPSGDYGPFIYALSGFSPTLKSFNGRDAIIGIHGTDEPDSIGRDVSHGCIRLRNDDLTRLVEQVGLPLGTPVSID